MEAEGELCVGSSEISDLVSSLGSTTLQNPPDLTLSSSSIKMHKFITKVSEQVVCFQIINLGGNGIYIWIGGPDGSMSDLSLAATTPYSASPTTTKIMGAAGDNCSETLGGKLARRLGKPVYLSFNLINSQFSSGWNELEKTLLDQLNSRPKHFFT